MKRDDGMIWDEMIKMMQDAVSMMDQVSLNITNLMNYEIDAIGKMADRIVDTECLILDMGKQIGVMADRIVKTEELMADAAKKCCGAKSFENRIQMWAIDQ